MKNKKFQILEIVEILPEITVEHTLRIIRKIVLKTRIKSYLMTFIWFKDLHLFIYIRKLNHSNFT